MADHVCDELGIKAAVYSLKKNLLMMLKVREFSDAARFRDPCLTFELEDVVCTYCTSLTLVCWSVFGARGAGTCGAFALRSAVHV